MNHPADCHCPDHHHPEQHSPDKNSPDHPDTAVGQALTYAGNGVRFQYPGNWTLTEESGADQVTITVQSPGTSYWMLTLFEDRPEPDRIVESVMEAYHSLYSDLDVYEPDVQIFGFPALTRELDFVCLDLVTTASLIAFQTVDQSLLVMYQGEDREMESARPLLESITRTLLSEIDAASEANVSQHT